jgi:hypothetical protein
MTASDGPAGIDLLPATGGKGLPPHDPSDVVRREPPVHRYPEPGGTARRLHPDLPNGIVTMPVRLDSTIPPSSLGAH